MTNEQEIVWSVFGVYLNDLKAYSTKPDRPTFKRLEEVRDRAIKALEQQRWIPVSERLPEKDEWVLITFDDGIEIASLDDDGWCYSSVGNDDWIAEHPPVAWMPLPQPYKAESEGEE